jgi:hypothetical protein
MSKHKFTKLERYVLRRVESEAQYGNAASVRHIVGKAIGARDIVKAIHSLLARRYLMRVGNGLYELSSEPYETPRILSSNARNYGIRYRIFDGGKTVYVYGYRFGGIGEINCSSCGETKKSCIHAELVRSDKRFQQMVAAERAQLRRMEGR